MNPAAALEALNKGNTSVVSVSSGSTGSCTAGGSYTDGSGHQQGYVT